MSLIKYECNLSSLNGFYFLFVTGGILLPDSPGINDPCEKLSRDAFANLNSQQREDITAAAQQVLRLIAFRQVKYYCGVIVYRS